MNKIKYKFLIYISHSYSIPTGLPLEKEIRKRGHEVMWFSDTTEGNRKLQTFENVFTHIKQAIDYQPHIVLVASNTVADFLTGIKVQIFHGFNAQKRPSKSTRFSHFKIRGFFDLYCTQGPSTTRYFKQLANKFRHFKVVETGWPKMDSLFTYQEILNKDKRPHILIASTFSKKISLAYNDEIYQEVKHLITTKKYKFSLVLHPKMPEKIINKWKQLCCDDFNYYETTELNPIFVQADRLLADTTSAIQEFILLRKPVIAFCNKNQPNYLINITSSDQLEQALDLDIANLKEMQNHTEQYIQQLHPYNDGKSSKRVIDESIKFLHADKQDLKNKPLNLNRKLKVRKRLKYFTFKSFNKAYVLKP
jgi:hypothetical protein